MTRLNLLKTLTTKTNKRSYSFNGKWELGNWEKGMILKFFDIMKNITLKELIKKYPSEILFEEIVDFESFDERLSVVDCIVANTIGVSERSIEFIPDNIRPLKDEILCWIWAFRPDLSKEILEITENKDMKVALSSYLNNTMDEFWDYMS